MARGRYTGGKEDYPKWKENFRNALNKSPCISRDGGTQEDNCMVLSFVGKGMFKSGFDQFCIYVLLLQRTLIN